MYNLPYYKEHDDEVIKDFIAKHPFAFLTGCNNKNAPVVTQVPIFFEERDGKKYLSGHIMKNTDHHKAFEHNEQVLAVFSPMRTRQLLWFRGFRHGSCFSAPAIHFHMITSLMTGLMSKFWSMVKKPRYSWIGPKPRISPGI